MRSTIRSIALGLFALSLVAGARAPALETGRPHGTPAPSPAEPLAAAREALDAGCEVCHGEIAAEWRESMHARAHADPVFRAEYEADPSAHCNGCHAPLASAMAPRAGAARGVGCVMCHAPHDASASVSEELGLEPRACADCHDFAFDERAGSAYAPGQRLQRTAAEHRASPAHARGETCASCHFPQVRSADGSMRTSHVLPGARDPEMLASSLSIAVDASHEPSGVRVEVTLESRAGHAVPTGDVYRTLTVHAEDADRPVDPAGHPRDDLVALRRHFETSAAGLVETLDDRVPADGSARRVLLRLPPGTSRVRWSVRWQALSPSLAARRGLDAAQVTRDVARGEVAVVTAPTSRRR